MKKAEYQVKAKDWDGKVVVKMPKVSERFQLMAEMNLKVNADSEVDSESLDPLLAFQKLSPKIPQYVESVDLKYKDAEIKKYEDLEYYNESVPVLVEIGMFLMQGATLSKN